MINFAGKIYSGIQGIILCSISKQQKVSLLPLQFEYLPVEVLSKEFTKLNNSHKYRIYYLGARPINSLFLHKKFIQLNPNYPFQLRKIIQSHLMTEKLKNNHYYKSAIYYRAFEGMNPSLKEQQFTFNSIFESGNLDCVIQVKPLQFDLFLRIDSNTRGHTQWYYFSIRNKQNNKQSIHLNICNLTKAKTLYDSGMKPYIFSKCKYKNENIGWQQNNTNNIIFQQRKLRYEIIHQKTNINRKMYQLSFQYKFQYENDQVLFAYSIPYTYTQLIKDIQELPKKFCKNDVIGYTLTGLEIPIVYIGQQLTKMSLKTKKNIVISGRIHPGESNSSYLIKGFMNFISSNQHDASQLRKRINFIIVPMINPDGVVMGNSRTSAAGKDLNRQYHCTKQELYPQVFMFKQLAAKLQKYYSIFAYLDFHGHSRRKNTFMYGPPYVVSNTQYYKCRVLPKMIQKIDNTFRFHSCSFFISQDKKTTARSVMFDKFQVPYTYTVQSSIGLYYDAETRKTYCFNEKIWEQMGKKVGIGLNQFIFSYEEYAEMLRIRMIERKQVRQKNVYRRNRKNFIEDQSGEQDINIMIDIGKKKSFLNLMQQMKLNESKMIEIEEQSDDHDENEDLQAFKLKQFNNLIVQSAVKEKSNFKKQEEIIKEQDSIIGYNESNYIIEQQQLLQELRTSRKKQELQTKNISVNKKINKSIFNFRKSTTHFKNTEKINQVQPLPLSPRKQLEKVSVKSKNFVLANRQRYKILTKVSFPCQEKRQILDLPNRMNNIGSSAIQGTSRTCRSSFCKKTISSQVYNNKIKMDKLRTKFHNKEVLVINYGGQIPLKYEKSKSIKKIQQFKQNSQTFLGLENLEIDNLAMAIKCINRKL